MKKLNLSLFVVCMLIPSCTYNMSSMRKSEIEEYKYDGFSLRCPRNVVINKKTPVEDFDIYEFIYDGNIILSAYVGNFPQFNHTHTEKGIINGLVSESFVIKEPDGSERKEVLIKFSERRGWPNYIHFSYSNLTPKLKDVVEQIILSTKEI